MIPRSKRVLFAVVTTLVALLVSVFLFPQETNAAELGTLFNKQPQLEYSTALVVQKSKHYRVQETELKKIEAVKMTLTEEVEVLKQQIAELDNMFVKINRYAPGSAGNLYVPGNCTWFVKSKRPDLPNTLGNAKTWYTRAKAQGWNVGEKPKKGAVGVSTRGYYGHVVYVEGVSLDGQMVTISEMNYRGLFSTNIRTVHYSTFKYIYELD